jgi:hypothetical protein
MHRIVAPRAGRAIAVFVGVIMPAAGTVRFPCA